MREPHYHEKRIADLEETVDLLISEIHDLQERTNSLEMKEIGDEIFDNPI